MDMNAFNRAVELAEKRQHVLVATSGKNGEPHVASAGGFDARPDGTIILTDWFCPRTVANLEHNPTVTIVVWNVAEDTGYQLIGDVVQMDDLNVMDGYVPEIEERPAIPQVERALRIGVRTILEFSHCPHSDESLN